PRGAGAGGRTRMRTRQAAKYQPERAPALRTELSSLLGRLPPRSGAVPADLVRVEERAGLRIEKLLLDLNGLEPVPATFVRPAVAAGPLPVVLYNHAHGGDFVLGKDELLHGRD